MGHDRRKNWQFETKAIHSGQVPEDGTGSVTTPIYPSSTYRVSEPGDESGYVYARWKNPTRQALEDALAELEGGAKACAFSSGLAALDAVIKLLKTGDHVVAVDDLYGGTMRQFEKICKRFGIEFSYVDGREADNFAKAIKNNTKLIWLETPTNPLLHVTDIEKVVELVKGKDILIGVDNTFATPYIQRPLELGADLVLHSMSKYLGGHCDLIAGALIAKDEKLGEQIWFNQYAGGGQLDPWQSWLVLRGIKTLHLRMERHSVNAMKIAEYLETVDAVSKVYFPGFDGKPVPNKMTMPGGMVSFAIDADFEAVKAFVKSLNVFVLAESLGGAESLVNHPAAMTHSSIPKEIREPRGITDGLVRLSVGVEHIDDLLIDLRTAFDVLKKKTTRV